MRIGTRRGLVKAKSALRIHIRQPQEPEDSEESSGESSPGSPDSVASSPSPAESAFPSAIREEEADTPSPTSIGFPSISKTESPSPTSITFPPSLTSSVKATSTTSASANIKTLTHASPIGTNPPRSSSARLSSTQSISTPAPPAVTNPAVIVSTSTSLGLTYTAITCTAILSRTQVVSSDAAEATTLLQNNGNGLGQTRPSDFDPGPPHRRGLDKGQIALVAIATLGFATLIIFFLWKWLRHRKGANQERVSRLYGSDTSSRTAPRPVSHKSDTRIMDQMMSAVYANENGRNSYQDRGPVNAYGYMDEKYAGFGDQQPILRPGPTANPNGTMDSTFENSISDWMNYQTQQHMLNPMTARNSIASSASWSNIPPFTHAHGVMSGNGMSAIQKETVPPPLDPRFAAANIQAAQIQNGGMPVSMYAGQEVLYLQRPPIPPEPQQPPGLRLPPPPGRLSIAPTEVTTNTESTWNTWGVIQHKEQPKNSWKGRFGV